VGESVPPSLHPEAVFIARRQFLTVASIMIGGEGRPISATISEVTLEGVIYNLLIINGESEPWFKDVDTRHGPIGFNTMEDTGLGKLSH
jgi:hypothetical protein